MTKLTKQQLDNFRLSDYSNRLLVKKVTDNKSLTTKSGIIVLPVVYIQNKAEHIDRVFEIIKQPKKLKFIKGKEEQQRAIENHRYKNEKGEPVIYFNPPNWKTEIETQVGDIVISSKWGADSAIEVEVEKEKYYFIDYHTLYLALTPGKPEIKKILGISISKITPLNGYIICKGIEEGLKSDYIILLPSDKSKIKHGIIKYLGKPNIEYYDDKYTDSGCDLLKEGDKIRKRKETIHLDLENHMHAVFSDDKLFVIQRKDIAYFEVS